MSFFAHHHDYGHQEASAGKDSGNASKLSMAYMMMQFGLFASLWQRLNPAGLVCFLVSEDRRLSGGFFPVTVAGASASICSAVSRGLLVYVTPELATLPHRKFWRLSS